MYYLLIVEDNLFFRNSLKTLLKDRFPYIGIELASNGEEALTKVDKFEPSLILMDINLPGRNGLELTKSIKSTSPETEIVILTSYNIPEYREAAFQSGASHFFTKGDASADDIESVVASSLASKDECYSPYPAN